MSKALRVFPGHSLLSFVLFPSPGSLDFRLLRGPRGWEPGTHHSGHKERLEGITLSIGIIVRVPCAGRAESVSRRCQRASLARQTQAGRGPLEKTAGDFGHAPL